MKENRINLAKDVAKGVGIGFVWYLGALSIVVSMAVAGGLMWWLGVFTSGTAGAGNVHKDQQSAQNREYWSQTFNDEMNTIKADQGKLKILKDQATGSGATQQDKINYSGTQQVCQDDVARYNSDANTVLGQGWIPAGFPNQINASDYCG